jgi:hypothetical protein
MKMLNTGKIKRFLPKKIQTRRAGYFGLALLIIFSLFTYDIFFRSPKVKAATIGTSSASTASGNEAQKHIVVTDRGVIVSFYNAGTQGLTGIVYSTSSDNGTTWSTAGQVATDQTSDFAVVIDGGNNIYIAYPSGVPASITVRKLSYSAGSWSVASSTTVASSTSGATSPTIAINSSGMVYVNYIDAFCTGGCTYTKKSYYSSNLSTWTSASANPSWAAGSNLAPIVSDGKSFWTIENSGGWIVYADVNGTGSWVKASGAACTATPNLSYYKDRLLILCQNGPDGMDASSYTISTATLSVDYTSMAGAGFTGTLATDSQNAWAIFQNTSGSGYGINYMRYDGSSWSGTTVNLINDGLSNVNLNVPERIPNTANVPIIWTTGTASPYTVKATTFSTTGSVTDTGNQTGSYTGTLTGSSGDTIVKCGTWYYNTVNIVSGMTVKVCASNGQTGGSLTIYANTVTVGGTVDGSGRGMPGGVSVYGIGGAGGTAGTLTVNSGNGGAGGLGLSFAGSTGSGTFGGAGGGAGTSASTSGAGGDGSTNGGGGAGQGSTTTSGQSGTKGGYLGSAVNGDTSTDGSSVAGSGGGAGGSGGSASGGGGGGSSCSNGSAGGAGAAGGIGGSGGDGGASVRIYSSGNLTISGTINITGLAGGTGAAGQTGANGGNLPSNLAC